MNQYDITKICAGVDCAYSLWDEQKKCYVPAQKRLYSVTLKQAFDDLVTSLETGEPLALNPERRAYADVQINEVEIPEDIAIYLAEHPEVTLNPASPVTQAALRLRMRSKTETSAEPRQSNWRHWQG